MIREDFLIRMIQEAMRILAQILNGNKEDAFKKKELEKCYNQFFDKDKSYFLDRSLDELSNTFKGDSMQNQLMRLEILAELLYSDTLVTKDSDEQYQLGVRAAYLFEYISKWSQTYSIERQNKLTTLKELCNLE